MTDTLAPSEHIERHLPDTVERAGELPRPDFVLQTPEDARDDFVDSVHRVIKGEDEGPILFKTMQFELNAHTRPIYEVIQEAHAAGIETRFDYDRIALRHFRLEGDPRSQAWHLGGLAVRRGDKAALREAYEERDLLINSLESLGITDRARRKRVSGQSRKSHDHIKIACAGSVAWLKTQNEREIDYDISNFSLRVTEPNWVEALHEIATSADQAYKGADKVYTVHDEAGEVETELMVDEGVPGQSVIYDKATSMIDSLEEGDEATLISQWPPVKMMFGGVFTGLQAKAKAGTKVTYLTSPEEDLHPVKLGARLMQRSIKKNELREENVTVINLPRATHIKGLFVKRKDGTRELLTGTNNLAERTKKNGLREVGIWTKDVRIVDQYDAFMTKVVNE